MPEEMTATQSTTNATHVRRIASQAGNSLKRAKLIRQIPFALSLALLFLNTGCQSFRWGERSSQDLDDLNQTKIAESHYWPALKPDRTLQDPAWTP